MTKKKPIICKIKCFVVLHIFRRLSHVLNAFPTNMQTPISPLWHQSLTIGGMFRLFLLFQIALHKYPAIGS